MFNEFPAFSCTMTVMPRFLDPVFIIAILAALAVHECAHAFAAFRLGDPTAKEEGRLTLNPVAHLDPMGVILFLLVGFGWGKPVPVDPRYFRHPKRDNALVALAGPAGNLLLALAAFAILLALGQGEALAGTGNASGSPVIIRLLRDLLTSIVFINLVLMAFNLLPVAPLDGSKILDLWIPPRHQRQYAAFMERGPMILLALIVLGYAFNLPILSLWIRLVTAPILRLMGVAT